MRTLVTGAKGQLGRELVRYLRAAGDEVIAWDLPDNDITDVEKTIGCIHLVRPDTIFHLAAWTDVDACENDRARAALVNFQGTWGVAMGAAEVGAQLLYVSTDYVFDGRTDRPYLETDQPAPLSVYGRTKLMGEQAVARTCRRRFIVRTAWLYGGAGRGFVDRIRERAQTETVIRVVSDQTGSPTWVRDLCEPMHQLVLSGKYGIYHLANTGWCSWFQLAQEVVRLLGLPCEVQPVKSAELGLPAPRPAFSVLDSRNYRKLTGRTLRPWQHALKEYLLGTKAT